MSSAAMEGQVDSRVMQHVRQDEPDLQPDFHNMLLLCFECIQFLLSVRISSTNAHKSKRSGMNLQYNHWGGRGGGNSCPLASDSIIYLARGVVSESMCV